MTIAIDFDGTCVTHEFPRVGQDIGAAPVLRKLVEAGHDLILYTMRSNVTDNTGYSDDVPEVHNGNFLDDAIKWFDNNGIPLYGVNHNPQQDSWTSSPKAYAQMYIDDAALGCPLWYGDHERPYVDWKRVEQLLITKGVI